MSDKLDFTKPEELQTRDGREVRIYATDGKGVLCVHGAFETPNGEWEAWQWTILGRAFVTMDNCEVDLIRKPRRIRGWVNVYPGGVLSKLGQDRVEASKHKGSSCIGQIYIDAEIQ